MSENKLVKSLMNVASVVGLFVIGYGVGWLFDTKPDYDTYFDTDSDTDDDDTEPDNTRERIHVEVNIS